MGQRVCGFGRASREEEPSASKEVETWNGKWQLERRENWAPYLTFLGVPEAAHEAATTAPDFHEYAVTESGFYMDHKIPGKNMHLRFVAFLDDTLQESPYPKPTATAFDEKTQYVDKTSEWKHSWVQYPTSLLSTMPDFAGKGKTVTLLREIESIDSLKYTVHVLDPETSEILVGPCSTWMSRMRGEDPLHVRRQAWTGKWALDRRENWGPYMSFLGVPEAAHEAAANAPDFHEYAVCESGFFMDHKIPGKNMHLRFAAIIDDVMHDSPYPKPTATMFDEGTQHVEKQNVWKHRWVQHPTSIETTLPDFAGKGKTVTMLRELEGTDAIKFTVHVLDPETNEKLVGPCYTWMKRSPAQDAHPGTRST